MSIVYNDTKKDISSKELHRLFMLVGWSEGEETTDMLKNFNLPFKNSTLVISAWYADRLVGVVRVLSDRIVRSVIYDLVVEPEFQGQGIGNELVKRCIQHFPDSEWLVGTTEKIACYYENIGFTRITQEDVFLRISSKWF